MARFLMCSDAELCGHSSGGYDFKANPSVGSHRHPRNSPHNYAHAELAPPARHSLGWKASDEHLTEIAIGRRRESGEQNLYGCVGLGCLNF
jgi:hypothetical protein